MTVLVLRNGWRINFESDANPGQQWRGGNVSAMVIDDEVISCPQETSGASVASESEMVESCMDMAAYFARKAAQKFRVSFADAHSEALAALALAARTHDDTRGDWPMHARVNIRQTVWRWARWRRKQLGGECLLDAIGEDMPTPDCGDAVNASIDASRIAALIPSLSPRHAIVIRLRFGFDYGEPMTLREIATQQGYSHGQAALLLTGALSHLRKLMR